MKGGGDNLQRRRFLATAGGTVVAALAIGVPNPSRAKGQTPSETALDQRLADVIEGYDAQGNHRTGTPADNSSAEWLAKRVHDAGAEPSLEPFALSRIDPQSCYVRITDRRIGGMPLFDATFTDAEGVRGTLGPIGSDAEIGLAESEPSRLTEPGSEAQRARVSAVRQAKHKAVILLTRGTKPGLFLLNAPAFKAPFGPPTLQISSAEGEWLKVQAQQRAEATLVAHVERTETQALNVTAHIAGSDPSLAPLVVTTPRSGWWQCASERGGGIGCWLEMIRVLAAGRPARDCFFVAMSGHEISWLGADAYMARRQDLPKRALAFVHFGANVGAARQPNLIQASSDILEQWAVEAMEREGLTVNRKAARGAAPFGEAAVFKRAGAQYVALVCDNDAFHNPADRWPDAVDVAVLARYATAFAKGALELAQQRP
jgi:Peptidase family M28